MTVEQLVKARPQRLRVRGDLAQRLHGRHLAEPTRLAWRMIDRLLFRPNELAQQLVEEPTPVALHGERVCAARVPCVAVALSKTYAPGAWPSRTACGSAFTSP
ncbi:MAG TPA: hypothetical protein VLT45_03875 [Kofleriaceae bacterium]|nr:hypothetical protein [Kofleriaceae bacterium]